MERIRTLFAKRWFWISAGGVGFLLLASLLVSPRKIETTPVTRQQIIQRIVSVGKVVPLQRSHMGSQTLGVVRAVLVREGQKVMAGELLVEMDDREAMAQLKQAEGDREAARARLSQLTQVGTKVAAQGARVAELQLKEAEKDFERQKELLSQRVISTAEFERSQQNLESAKVKYDSALAQVGATLGQGSDVRQALASVSMSEARVEQARSRVSQMKIVAPFSGVILNRDVEPGDVVQPAHPLLSLGSDGKPLVVSEIDEKNIGLLKLGQVAKIAADAFPSQFFEAKLVQLSPQVNAERGTIEAKFEVENPPDFLRIDMSVSVNIEVASKNGALVLPSSYVRDLGTESPWALVVEEGRVHRKSVVLGVRGESAVEVVSGVKEGDLVVPATVRAVDGERARAAVKSR